MLGLLLFASPMAGKGNSEWLSFFLFRTILLLLLLLLYHVTRPIG